MARILVDLSVGSTWRRVDNVHVEQGEAGVRFATQVAARGIDARFGRMLPGSHPPIATQANDGGDRAVDDRNRRVIHQDGAGLQAVEEGEEPRLWRSLDRAALKGGPLEDLG